MPAGYRLAAVAAAVTLLAACTGQRGPATVASTAPSAPTGAASAPPSLGPVKVAYDGLAVPWGVAFLPDGSALVTERDSHRVLRLSGGRATEVAVIGEARSTSEGGLLGIAASPEYATDGTLYLYYSAAVDNRIARWHLGGRPEPIVTGIPVSGVHDGGRLAFGPDGYLYATTGDAGTGGRAQDLSSLGGKILRMTGEGKPAPGNPFGTLVWSYGHRNVQGIAWDAGGHLWATEFGQNAWDEINLITPGGNYGWPVVEGAAGDNRFIDPVVAWHPAEASCSGAAVWRGTLVVGCLRGQRLWLTSVGEGGTLAGEPVAALVGAYGRLRTVVAAPDGGLWVTTSNRDGRGDPAANDDRVLRLTAT